MNEEKLQSRMDRIIEWVKTCDTKASIMLSILSLTVGIFFTSDFVLDGLLLVIRNTFVVSEKGSFSLSALCALLSAVFTMVSLMVALWAYVLVLKAKTDESQTGDTSLLTESFIHFNHISKLTYENFVAGLDGVDVEKDLSSQIYINAKRCAEKYSDFNRGVRWTWFTFASSFVMVLSLLIYCSYFKIS